MASGKSARKQLLGLVLSFILLVAGAFMAFRSFVPKSQPAQLSSSLIELVSGMVILVVAASFIRKFRAALSTPENQAEEKNGTSRPE